MTTKLGKMVAFTYGRQHVLADDGETFWLTPGWDAASGAKVGDRIKLTYRSTPTLALWYGSVVPQDTP